MQTKITRTNVEKFIPLIIGSMFTSVLYLTNYCKVFSVNLELEMVSIMVIIILAGVAVFFIWKIATYYGFVKPSSQNIED